MAGAGGGSPTPTPPTASADLPSVGNGITRIIYNKANGEAFEALRAGPSTDGSDRYTAEIIKPLFRGSSELVLSVKTTVNAGEPRSEKQRVKAGIAPNVLSNAQQRAGFGTPKIRDSYPRQLAIFLGVTELKETKSRSYPNNGYVYLEDRTSNGMRSIKIPVGRDAPPETRFLQIIRNLDDSSDVVWEHKKTGGIKRETYRAVEGPEDIVAQFNDQGVKPPPVTKSRLRRFANLFALAT